MNDSKALERAERIAMALRCCGNSPKVDRCKAECMFYQAGCMAKCIPAMTEAAATLIEQLTAEPPNAPLTIEELWGMYGEPVWVELLNRDIPCGTNSIVWASMRGATNGYIRFPFKKYKKTWLAYRRRPEEETT